METNNNKKVDEVELLLKKGVDHLSPAVSWCEQHHWTSETPLFLSSQSVFFSFSLEN